VSGLNGYELKARAEKILEATPDDGRPLTDRINGAVTAAAAVSRTAQLLDRIRDFLTRYVVLPGEDELTALALFVAHTYAFESAHATPYLLVLSPEKRSGKTLLLETLSVLVARPWKVAGSSEAAMFRKIALEQPTLLLDEIDAVFGAATERTEPLRAILNAGNRRGAAVARCGGKNRDEVFDFDIFCPKVLAGIDTGHRLPDTIRDRAITIRMVRKTRAEPVDRFRYRDAVAAADELRADLVLWAADGASELDRVRPEWPDLDDRAAEAWEPLLVIADLADGDWSQTARSTAERLSGRADDDDAQRPGGLLLAAAQIALNGKDRISTSALLTHVNDDDELPFGGWRDGGGLDARGLARLLRPYGVRPETIRTGDTTCKGYQRTSFADAWDHWLPPTPEEAEQGKQAEQERPEKPLEQADVTDVTAVTATPGESPPERNNLVWDFRTTTEPTMPKNAEAAQLLGVSAYDEAGE
jgi:hypothetical protein